MSENNKKIQSYQEYDGYYKYDKNVADSYEESRRVEQHWEREDDFVKKYLQRKKVKKLLDIPVGTGRFFDYYNKIDMVIGVDISDAMIAKSQEKLSRLSLDTCITIEQGDIFDLRFDNSEFDCIIVFRLFHLMSEQSISYAIKELCRVADKDIIVQSYVQPNKLRYLTSKIISKLNIYKPKTDISEGTKPWSHIQAYYHSQSFLDSEFKKHNFFPVTYKVLDIYGDYDVRATIYSKKN